MLFCFFLLVRIYNEEIEWENVLVIKFYYIVNIFDNIKYGYRYGYWE